MKIFKYPLSARTFQIVEILSPAIILSAESQKDDIVLYALVDETSTIHVQIGVAVFGTGSDISTEVLKTHKFLDTVKMYDGKLMFHVFIKNLTEAKMSSEIRCPKCGSDNYSVLGGCSKCHTCGYVNLDGLN